MEGVVGAVEYELGGRAVEPFGNATAVLLRNLRLDPLAVQERELVVPLGDGLVFVDEELVNSSEVVFAVGPIRVEGLENETVVFGGLVPDSLLRYRQDLSICREVLGHLD